MKAFGDIVWVIGLISIGRGGKERNENRKFDVRCILYKTEPYPSLSISYQKASKGSVLVLV